MYSDAFSAAPRSPPRPLSSQPRGAPPSSRAAGHSRRGIDVGAKEDVYVLIREMSAAGLGVLLLADTLEEIIGLSHTILVMRDGVITACFEASPGAKPEQVALVEHMV